MPTYQELVGRHGSKAEAARALGIPVTTFKDRLNRELQDPALLNIMEVEGSNLVPQNLWKRGVDADGNKYTAHFKPVKEHEAESLIDKIEGRFLNIPPAPSIIRPTQTNENLRAFYPLFDAHLAMRSGGYGLQAGVDRLESGMAELLGRTDPAASCLILNGGDFTHQDDWNNQTVKSKNPLDVDGSYEDTIEAAVDVTVHLIEMALQRHGKIFYRGIKGNHDPHTAVILLQALKQRYRECDRVEVLPDKNLEFFVHVFGKCFIGAQHGDARGGTVKDLVLAFAARYAKEWGNTEHREVWTGHMHHLKAQEVAGATHHQARAITPPDSHVRKNLFTSRSEMQSVVYHHDFGRYGGATHTFPDVDWAA